MGAQRVEAGVAPDPMFSPGHRYDDRDATRSRDYQDSRLAACGVDPAVWGDRAEIALFGQDGFKAMAAGGHQVDGVVHIGQRFRLLAPVMVGEPLTQSGWIDRFETHARGQVFTSIFEIRRADGTLAVVSELTRLIPDPARMGGGGSTPTARPDPRDGLEPIASKTMSPADVTLFSGDVGNLIHFEPDFARGLGYRAPLAQGLQTAVWMLQTVAGDGAPDRLDVSFRFRRPVHWDDAMTLWAGQIDGGTVARALDESGRITAEMRVAP